MAQKKKVAKKATKSKAPAKQKAVAKKKTAPETIKPASESTKKMPTRVTVKRSTLIKVLVGIVVALVLLPVIDWIVQTSIVSQYVAFNGNNDVTRKEYLMELEDVAGEGIAATLVRSSIVDNLAEEKDIQVTQEEVDNTINSIMQRQGFESQDDFYAYYLTNQGITKKFIQRDIYETLVMNKAFAEDVEPVTDAEVEEYFKQNKETLYPDQTFEEVKDAIREDLEFAALYSKGQEWLNAQVDAFDETNYLVSEDQKSYKFMRSFKLMKQLFAK